MAHTVESLTKITNKSADELIALFNEAGITDKTADSEVSTAEVKTLMDSINNKRKASSIKLTQTTTTVADNKVRIQVKGSNAKASISNTAQEAIEKSKQQALKEREQDLKRQEALKKQQEQQEQKLKQQEEEKAKTEEAKKAPKEIEKVQETKAKKPTTKPKENFKKQEDNTKDNKKTRLKKKDRSKISQKLKEEQAQHAFQKPVEKVVLEINVPEMIQVSELALRMKIKAGEVLKVMMGMGVMATLNDAIDQDTAMLVVEELGHIPIEEKSETIEDTLTRKKDNVGEPRPPIVTIMGHVDHGKTSLLDYIRKTKVTSSEAGGITQHIGAYQVSSDNGLITFIDTPGHAAFGKMRERGANATDIVVLVVAADDGVMPQTVQSIEYAKKSNAPIIVAINKIDKEGADVEKTKQILSSHDVVAEDWGGDTIICPISAHTGEGINELLNNISLTAEIMELQAEKNTSAHGIVLEAKVDKGRGKVVNVLVQSGTLNKGDIVVAGLEYGKVKQIITDTGKTIQSAGPSTPVELLGFNGVPNSGDEVLVVENERKAREVTAFRTQKAREKELQKQQTSRMDSFLDKMKEADMQIVNIMVKADVRGSTQAIVDSLEELSTDEVRVKIISSGVGAISNTDVVLAETSNATILGFNVRADNVAKKEAANIGVKIKYYSIIYNLIDDVKAMMSGKLAPELSEKIIGVADVKDVFKSPKFGDIAGCIVTEGAVRRDSPIRVLRDSIVVFEGELESLRRFKDDVSEVKSGIECGIGVVGYQVEIGDQIEVFERIETARTL